MSLNSKPSARTLILQVLLVIGLCVISIVVLASLGVFRQQSPEAVLVFRVEASGGYANITLEAGGEIIPQAITVTTPWERRIIVPRGEEVYLTAANPTQTGQLSCTISIERRVWKRASTEAPKNGVACAGIVP
ncbi:MAG: hypothetical protein AB1453_12505 [Chloroflexota bacterium]|jgi:hypothetical protein